MLKKDFHKLCSDKFKSAIFHKTVKKMVRLRMGFGLDQLLFQLHLQLLLQQLQTIYCLMDCNTGGFYGWNH